MIKIFLIFSLLLLNSCIKPKTILICGDHVCINKAEAKQYFEENLSLEVKIINKENKNKFDLVELNLKESKTSKKKIFVVNKQETNQKLKTLSKEEIDTIKQKIKNKEKREKIVKKNQTDVKDIIYKKENDKIKDINLKQNQTDVCKILKECNIDEISKHLIKLGNKKKFPDITIRE